MDTVWFREALLAWYASSYRPLPWKEERDPYRIWLSEVILQQTRVDQGLPYYLRFTAAFPTVYDLARADEQEVLKLWEGLGYYNRARNMLATAREIAWKRGGRFPASYEGLQELKGVGPYTAAAISSFAYGLPHAVLDGNVFRVLSRFFGVADPVHTTAGKKKFATLAHEALDHGQPGRYNQAIMDFGATVCKPKAPECTSCPLREKCMAFEWGKQQDLPLASPKPDRLHRYFHYLVMSVGDLVYIRQRRNQDIWQGLFEFPCLEMDSLDEPPSALQNREEWELWTGGHVPDLHPVSSSFRQTLSHQVIHARFWRAELPNKLPAIPENWSLVDRRNLNTFAWPRLIDWYFQDNSLYLNL